jgi:hypothetical protein
VLADWWFSLALSQNICQAKAGKSAAQTVFLGYSKMIASSESQPLKGLSDNWAAIAACPERAC